MKEKIPFESYLVCDGKVFTVDKVKYVIRAKLRTQKYPYTHDYVDLSAEHQDEQGKTWFLDLISSESKTCEKLFGKMEKVIDAAK